MYQTLKSSKIALKQCGQLGRVFWLASLALAGIPAQPHYNNVPNLKMLLKLLLNSAVSLDRSPAQFAWTGWNTCPVSLALLTLLGLMVIDCYTEGLAPKS